jgi:radical SAM superfamily enzyme YgiQ (UPF0313 family)
MNAFRNCDENVYISSKYYHPFDIVNNIHRSQLKGTKVTFINMPIREHAKPNNPPMGPALLAARLLDYDADVHIIDLNAYRTQVNLDQQPKERMLTYTEATQLLEVTFNKHGNQDLIALSGLITTLRWQKEIAAIVRKLQPQALLVSGGGLATEFRGVLFKWIRELDAIAHSEGDDIIIKIAYDAKIIKDMGINKAVASGKLAPYFIGMENGRPRFYYDGGRPHDLDALPFPAWHLLDSDVNGEPILENYIKIPVWGGLASNSSAASFTMERSLSMISSRGCPFNCRFCYRGAQGERKYGIRSAQNVIREMEQNIKRYNLDFIGIIDDNFMVNSKRIKALAVKIQPLLNEMKFAWGTHGRLDEAADLNQKDNISRIEEMAKSGCIYIGFGGESASSVVLNEMGKGGFILQNGEIQINDYTFPVTMVEGIKKTKQAGIHANCTWIMGYPGETLKDLKTTVAFIKWQEELYTRGLRSGSPEYEKARDSVNKSMFVATAYPGTEMARHPVVRKKLATTFGIHFDSTTKEAIPDDNLFNYVLALDDATKVLEGKGGILYYGDMDVDQFRKAKEYVEKGNIYKILDM